MDIFKTLNDKQSEAVRATEGYVRVIAGAGSGKTKLLVSRYAYLVKDYGIDSANILCVTFTNKAAGEMKKRIRSLIGAQYDTTLICTYHGFCARLLREDPEKLFLNKGFQIIDSSQQKAILEDIYGKYELKLDYAGFENILKKIGRVKRDYNYVVPMCNPSRVQILPKISTQDDKIIEDFLQKQKAIYALDFHDLINFALYLLENDADIREKWQERLNYIQVDEFQDSSAREMRLVELLSQKYGNLMIVGDPDQNIYEWRGSDVKLLVDFDKTHVPTETIFLNRNYRSTPQILKCANTLIDKNKLRLKKDLFTLSPDGAAVCHYHSKSDAEETALIAENIKRLMKEQGLKYSDFAVLYRSGFLSRVVEKGLVENNIPYEIFGGVRFYQRMEVLDVIAYLRLIAFDDDISFKRVINTPKRKFGRAKLAALENLRDNELSIFTESQPPSLFSTLKSHLGDGAFRASGAAEFVRFVNNMREFSEDARISEIVQRVTAESGYEQYIRELGDEERLENLAEFKRIADEFERSFGEELSLKEFLAQIAIQSNEDSDKPADTVKLMTIHASKGLEFPAVFVIGFTEGIFPSSKTVEERKNLGLEEERRLCYVALTRAERFLFIMDSEGVSQNGIKKLPSRFLREIGVENYTRIGKIDEELLRESAGYVSRQSRGLDVESGKKVGDRVEHHIFGGGEIIAKDEKRGSYTVKFDRLAQPRNLSRDYFDSRKDEDVEAISAPVETAAEQRGAPESLPPESPCAEEPSREAEENEALVDAQTESEISENADSDDAFEEVERVKIDAVEKEQLPAPSDENESEPSDNSGELTDEQIKELERKLAEAQNLWKRDDVPHSGWRCVGITDLGAPCGVCEMCGYQIIRYVHHMVHDAYRPLNVGCVCAGKMEGDVAAARKRERDFKSKQTRHANFRKKPWKTSRNGNSYLKIKEHVFVLYKNKFNGKWKYSVDNVFCDLSYDTREAAVDAVFEKLEQLTRKA